MVDFPPLWSKKCECELLRAVVFMFEKLQLEINIIYIYIIYIIYIYINYVVCHSFFSESDCEGFCERRAAI